MWSQRKERERKDYAFWHHIDEKPFMPYNLKCGAKEKKEKEKTAPCSINLMRSQVLYRAGQVWSQTHNVYVTDINLELILNSTWRICNHFVLQAL